jgi:tight adherence protein B
MALVGLTIGDGRAAYASPSGQLAVVAGVAVTAACWVWATAIMRLPEDERVLAR